MASLTIGKVARRAGLRPSAIRYYESLGILPVPERMNGRRRYDPDILHVLRAIGVAKQAGLSMTELQQLFQASSRPTAPSLVWEQLARRKLADIEAMIQQARTMRALLEEGLRCGCLGWDECVLFGRQHDSVNERSSVADAD